MINDPTRSETVGVSFCYKMQVLWTHQHLYLLLHNSRSGTTSPSYFLVWRLTFLVAATSCLLHSIPGMGITCPFRAFGRPHLKRGYAFYLNSTHSCVARPTTRPFQDLDEPLRSLLSNGRPSSNLIKTCKRSCKYTLTDGDAVARQCPRSIFSIFSG